MTNAEKAQENRLRRMADRQGLTLVKNRRRDPLALGYGRYKLVRGRRTVAGAVGGVERFDLSDVERFLTSYQGG